MGFAITTKGQVTLPKGVRERLGVKPGDEIEFDLNEAGDVVVRRAGRSRKATASRFAKLRGSAGPGMSTDELMKLLRD